MMVFWGLILFFSLGVSKSFGEPLPRDYIPPYALEEAQRFKKEFLAENVQAAPVDLTFDREEFNSLGGAINKATGTLLGVHFAWRDARRAK